MGDFLAPIWSARTGLHRVVVVFMIVAQPRHMRWYSNASPGFDMFEAFTYITRYDTNHDGILHAYPPIKQADPYIAFNPPSYSVAALEFRNWKMISKSYYYSI